MLSKKLTVIVIGIFIILFLDCGSTQMNVSQSNPIHRDNFSFLTTKIVARLSDLNVDVEVAPAPHNRYDLIISWNMNAFAMNALLKSDTKDKTIGVVVGMMIVMAAVVGDETAYDLHARNLIYRVNGEKFAYIPISKCQGFMPLVKKKQVYKAIARFAKYVTLNY